MIPTSEKKEKRILSAILRAKIINAQSRSKAYMIGNRHYDIGNRLFSIMLDKRMNYSCGYSAWQRGSNENTNGLLRQYFPKGSNFKNIENKDLALAVKKLNHRPRKCLKYQTPHEVFYKTVRGALAA